MMNGILRIQTYRPRQSAPVEGVTVVITGSGFTAHRITDAAVSYTHLTLPTIA